MRKLCSAAVVVALALTADLKAQQTQTPVFRTGIDVVTVEASVIDRDGKPITDLTPVDFIVELDGKPRKVRDARFYHDESAETVATASVPPVPGPVVSSGDSGRIVVFVVDSDSIAPGNERVVFETAGTVLDGLGPSDAAGLLSLPGSAVDLTRDHARVRAALMRVTGSRPPSMQVRDFSISWDEAAAFGRQDAPTIGRVVDRECPGSRQPRNPCWSELESYARQMLLTGRFRTQNVLNNLASLAKDLAPLRGPKQIVLLSSGFAFGQELLPLFNEFAARIAEAQISFYAVLLQGAAADVTSRNPLAIARGIDPAGGMSNAASMTDGAFFMATGSAAGIFERIRTELNNFYQLAIELEPGDPPAETPEVKLKVSRPGASIRNQRRAVPPARAAALGLTDRLGDLIRQPVDIGEIPLAVSAYSTRGDDPSTLRTIVGIEAGTTNNTAPAEWAFAVYSEGNVVAKGRQTFDGAAGPWAAALSAKLLPGRYRLRTAVLDAGGRAGVLERPLDVGLRGDAKVQFSDLLVGVADAGGKLQPMFRVSHGDTVSALIEVISADAATLEQGKTIIELIPAGTAEPIKRFVMGARSGASPAIVTNQVQIPTADLPVGRYTAVATVTINEQPIGRVSRVFELITR